MPEGVVVEGGHSPAGGELARAAERVHTALRRRGETVAVAESLTGGMLASTLVDRAGASDTFRGGVVVYATDLKPRLAGVSTALLAEVGPVDPEVTRQLAAGVRDRCAATWGAATTGVGGPGPRYGHPPGTVWVAVAGPDGSAIRGLTATGSRTAVRVAAVLAALDLLDQRLSTPP